MPTIEELTNVTTSKLTEITVNIGELALWLQAIGILIIFWLIFNIISLYNQRSKRKRLYAIENRLKVIEKKLDKLLNSTK